MASLPPPPPSITPFKTHTHTHRGPLTFPSTHPANHPLLTPTHLTPYTHTHTGAFLPPVPPRIRMAQTGPDWPPRVRCSYKTATIFICAFNVLAALYVLHSLLRPLDRLSSSPSSSLDAVLLSRRSSLRALRYTDEQLNRIKEAVEVWKAAEPVELIKRVKEIRQESLAGARTYQQVGVIREKVASDLAQRLKELRGSSSHSDQQALEEWRQKKLEDLKKREEAAKTKQE